jgi:hypothetical protein
MKIYRSRIVRSNQTGYTGRNKNMLIIIEIFKKISGAEGIQNKKTPQK